MREKLSIALIGQAAFGESVLNALVENGESVVGVFCPPEKEGAKPEALRLAAEQHGIPVCQFKRMRDQEAIDAYRALDADLGVMAFVTDIVPEEILTAPTQGTIQYHPSLLPKHRGPSSINWPIIQGDTKTGLTIFWPDAGLDTGPVLLQKETDIGANDTLGTVYFDRLFAMGVDAMVESVKMVHDGTAPKLEQDESAATYEGWCRAKDCIIDWTKPAQEVHNLVRGADPSPGAGSTFQGDPIQVYQSRLGGESGDAVPGTVVEIADDGVHIACGNGSVIIGRVRAQEVGKVKVAEWVAHAAVEVGARVGE